MRITAIVCTPQLAIVTQQPNLLDRLLGRCESTAVAVLLPAPGSRREWCWATTKALVSKRVEHVLDRALLAWMRDRENAVEQLYLRVVRQSDAI